jgi:hypothetical protein
MRQAGLETIFETTVSVVEKICFQTCQASMKKKGINTWKKLSY